MNIITSVFKEKKLKLTPQRIAVYEYLMSTKKHPSAEVVYKALQSLYPTMSLATVYKALKTLVDVNLVQELNVGEGNFRYDGNSKPHSHIQCLNCGKVDDIEGIVFTKLNNQVREFTDYEVITNQIYFYGICQNCNKIKNNP